MARKVSRALALLGAAAAAGGLGCGGSGAHQDAAAQSRGAAYEHNELDAFQVFLVGGSGGPYAQVARVVASSPTGCTRHFTGRPTDLTSESEYTLGNGIGLAATLFQLPGVLRTWRPRPGELHAHPGVAGFPGRCR